MGSIPFEVTEDLIMERAVLEKAVYVEAKKRGLLPSQEEIAEKVNYYRRSTYESQDPDYAGTAAEDNKKYWNAY
jgi:hypothetical protein